MTTRSKGRRVPAAPAPTPSRSASSRPATDGTRQAYYRTGKQPEPCPACGGDLAYQQLNYLIATQSGKKSADSFMLGAEGYVCRQCAAVVVDPQYISQFLHVQLPHGKVGKQFTIPGLVDLDAVPENKRELPLGDDDNPLPLIPLTFPEAT